MKKLALTCVAMMASVLVSFGQIFSSGRSTIDMNTILNSVGSYMNSQPVNSNVVYQQGYTRSNGTYVSGHYKTKANNTNWDNFSTVGNLNSFTGSAGTVARDYSKGAYNYGSGRTIHTGSRGGQYYINSNGNKTYVPKRSSSISLW